MGITLLSQCRKPETFSEEGYDERMSGGSQTAFDNSSQAFTHEFDNLSEHDLSIHELGDAGFEQTFVTAPAPVNSGLGPAFNNVSCVSCHHNDGKGVPTAGAAQSSLLMRIVMLTMATRTLQRCQATNCCPKSMRLNATS